MGNIIEILSPYNGKLIKSIPANSALDAEQALDRARKAFDNKTSWLKHHERIAILEKLAVLVSKEKDEFALLIAKEGGKPLIDAKVEVSRAIEGIKTASKELQHTFEGKEIPMGFTKASENRLAFTIYQPCGVVLAISAFNHPLNLCVHQIIPAIAVGCPVIMKPATKTPLCSLRLMELIHEAGLPKDWCQVVVCSSSIAETMVSDSRINFFSFIGSSKVGWYLRNKLYPGVRYTLEHGGAAPVIIDKNIDNIEQIASSVVKGGFYHAGQVCISVQRVFIHEDIFVKFVDMAKSLASQQKVGDPTLIETTVGPMVSEKEVDRVDSWVKEAVSEGASVAYGGSKVGTTAYSPTILLNPSFNSKVSQQEVFGPVILLYSYSDITKAIEYANGPNLPFQAGVFSKDIDKIMKVVYELDSVAVMVNDHSAFRTDWMPFSGRGVSGAGVGGIGYAMHEMTNYKMAVIKSEGIL